MVFGSKKRAADRIVSEELSLKSLLQLPDVSSDEPRIIFDMSSQITCDHENHCSSAGNDPFFLLHIPDGLTQISIEAQISSSQDTHQIALYFSFEDDKIFSEQNKYTLGCTDGIIHRHHLVFPAPVFWLRLDPIDAADAFVIHRLSVVPTDTSVQGLQQQHVGSFHQLPIQIRWHLLGPKLQNTGRILSDGIVYVTHELSGTGAPLLCRKMSQASKNTGRVTILMILPSPLEADEETCSVFQEACDILLVCHSPEDVSFCAGELSKLGINKAVMHSVVCGSIIQRFREVGFRSVCLVHEMRASCNILHAQKWIESIAQHADTIIFPAKCVQDDFESFGVQVKEKSMILPQGFYKNEENKEDQQSFQSARTHLRKRLDLKDDAILILSAGSINFGKGADLLPLIALELQQMGYPEFHFLWLGTTNEHRYEVWLLEQIRKMGLAEHFHFLGYISQDTEYMNIFRGCNALALVSREDSYPSVMLEAMSCRVPVVAFLKSGGSQDLLAYGKGFLVDYMNIRAFSRMLLTIKDEPDRVQTITEKAYAYICSSMDFQEYVARIHAILTEH